MFFIEEGVSLKEALGKDFKKFSKTYLEGIDKAFYELPIEKEYKNIFSFYRGFDDIKLEDLIDEFSLEEDDPLVKEYKDRYFNIRAITIWEEDLGFGCFVLDAAEYNAEIDKIFNMDENYVGNKKDVIYNVLDDLHELKKNIRGLEVDTGKNDIVNGYIGVNCAWSGDAVYSMELGEAADPSVSLWYSVPEEGSNIWFDGWCMPKNSNRTSTQKALAMEFLNFISSPAVAALNMESTGYTSFAGGDSILDLVREWYDCRYNEETEEFEEVEADEIAANLESGDWQEVDLSYFFKDTLVDYEDEDMKFYTNEDTGFYLPFKEDGNISCGGAFFCQYPDEEVINRCCVMKDFGEYNETITKMWEQFKSTTLEPWAFVLLALEVGAALGIGVYFFIKKKQKMALKAARQNID